MDGRDFQELIEAASTEELHAIAAAPIPAVGRLTRNLEPQHHLLLHANADAIAEWARLEVIRRATVESSQLETKTADAAMTQPTASEAPNAMPFGGLGAPIIEEPVLDCGSVRIHNLRKGATLTVFFDRGLGFPPSMSVLVTNPSMTITRPVELGGPVKTVFAQQSWSSLTSPWSNEAPVQSGVIRRTPMGLNTLCRLTSNALEVQGVPVPGWSEARIGTDLGISTFTQDGWRIFFGDATPQGSSPAGVVKPIFQLRPTPPFVNENGDLDCGILEGLPTPPPDACASVATFEKQSHTTFESLLVDGLSLDQYFEVPSGAFFFDGRTYVFVTKRGGAFVRVPELVDEHGEDGDIMLASFLVSRGHDCERFRVEFGGPVDTLSVQDLNCSDLPCIGDASHLRFINVAPVVVNNDNGQIPELPAGNLLLMWGTGIYHRDSKVYFAYAQLVEGEAIPSPNKWQFLVGNPNAAKPTFVADALPDLVQQLAALDLAGVQDGTGEISVQWIAPLNRWMLFVWQSSHPATMSCFVAEKPWGPWTETTFIDPSDPFAFDVINGTTIIGSPLPQRGMPLGLMYGNYIVEPYTTWNPNSQVARVHIVSSFNNPQGDSGNLVPPGAYGTVLLGLDLQCADSRFTHREGLYLPITFS